MAVDDTLAHIANNTIPSGPAGTRFGVVFRNDPLKESSIPELPFSTDPKYYHEYRIIPSGVQPLPGTNVLRLVTGGRGEVYYTFRHYGTADNIPGVPFVRLR